MPSGWKMEKKNIVIYHVQELTVFGADRSAER